MRGDKNRNICILPFWKFLKNSFKSSLLAHRIIPGTELQRKLFLIHCTGQLTRKERRCSKEMFGNLHEERKGNRNGNNDSILAVNVSN